MRFSLGITSANNRIQEFHSPKSPRGWLKHGKQYLIFILQISLTLALTNSAAAERNVILEEDGIIVEEDTGEDRVLPIMIGTTTMNTNIERIVSWVTAVHTYVDWQHNCEEARELTLADGSTLTYNRIDSPWPVNDRDVILRSARVNLESGVTRLEFQSTDEANLKTPRGVVRMPRLVGSYVLTPVEDGKTHVVYTVDSDPGGNLPAWLVRRASKDLPYLTLKNLRSKVETGPPPPP